MPYNTNILWLYTVIYITTHFPEDILRKTINLTLSVISTRLRNLIRLTTLQLTGQKDTLKIRDFKLPLNTFNEEEIQNKKTWKGTITKGEGVCLFYFQACNSVASFKNPAMHMCMLLMT